MNKHYVGEAGYIIDDNDQIVPVTVSEIRKGGYGTLTDASGKEYELRRGSRQSSALFDSETIAIVTALGEACLKWDMQRVRHFSHLLLEMRQRPSWWEEVETRLSKIETMLGISQSENSPMVEPNPVDPQRQTEHTGE